MPRFFIDASLTPGQRLRLPTGASRHVQVLRLQPGDTVTLFNGLGGQWQARIERMDWLVEKATELGVASLQPLLTAHSVLRLSGDRAEKKRLHWQAICAAACEQCGGNRLARIEALLELPHWLRLPRAPAQRFVLSLQADAQPLAELLNTCAPEAELLLLSGPEGGLSKQEEAAARASGFVPASLGPRVLRAETAALAALSLALRA